MQDMLKSHKSDGIFFSHVSMITPKGRYRIGNKDANTFWELYCNIVQHNTRYSGEGVLSNATAQSKTETYLHMGIAEKPISQMPVIVDIDIKVLEDKYNEVNDNEINDNTENNDSNMRLLYNEEHVKSLIEVYQIVLQEIIDTDEESLDCCLLEKPAYKRDYNGKIYIKNGFHLHFPKIFMNTSDIELHLIPKVKDYLKNHDVFIDLKEKYDIDTEKLIDYNILKNPWLLYGSKKDVESFPYLLTTIYDLNLEEIDISLLKDYCIYDSNLELIEIKNKKQLMYYLPRIFSIIVHGRSIKSLKKGVVSHSMEFMKTNGINKQVKINDDDEEDNEPLDDNKLMEIRTYLNMLKRSRSEDYAQWMEVGWVLYCITNGTDKGFEMWCDFSKGCGDKYDEDRCTHEWSKMVRKGYTMGTLKYFASKDNPDAYKAHKENKTAQSIEETLKIETSHADIAKILHIMYGDEFVCSSFSNKTWYQYKNHHWKDMDEEIFLRKKISEDILKKYETISKTYWTKLGQTNDKSEQVKIRYQLTVIQKTIAKLKTNPYKNNIMKECAEVFYKEGFRDKLDANPYLIAFQNGVYDLSLCIFRDGKPEDYISKVLPINYVEYEDHDEKILQIKDYFNKVFPDTSIKEYFLDNAMEIFTGGNPKKKVFVWSGEGDNGKSITECFFETMLGKYSVKSPTTLITGKKPASGAPWPELVRCKGVRWVALDEPDEKETINVGTLKHLSGGTDTVYARELFQKGKDIVEIKILFKLILICNKLPNLGTSDRATWNRLRVIPFEATFCVDAPDTYEQQLLEKRFPIDTNFHEKIPDLVEPLAFFLLNRRKHSTKLHPEPEKVLMATNEYRKRNDSYRQYIEERIDECATAKITLTELYTDYKQWHRESLPGFAFPVKNDVKAYFCKIWGTTDTKATWLGYKIRTLNDDIQSGRTILLTANDLNQNTMPLND